MEVSLRRKVFHLFNGRKKIASKKAVPKNTTTAVNWAFRVFLDWVHHSKEVEGCSYTVQDLWRHAHSEDQNA